MEYRDGLLVGLVVGMLFGMCALYIAAIPALVAQRRRKGVK